MAKISGKSFRNIILIGMPGSGKSTFGKTYAHHTRRAFLDFDRMVERAAGKSIPQIFTEDGEAAFRALEQKCLRKLERRQNSVIALGGGTACNDEALEFLRSVGLLVHLHAGPDALSERVMTARDRRPMFAACETRDDAKARILELWERRRAWYEAADVTLETAFSSVDNLKIQLGVFEARTFNRDHQRDLALVLGVDPQEFALELRRGNDAATRAVVEHPGEEFVPREGDEAALERARLLKEERRQAALQARAEAIARGEIPTADDGEPAEERPARPSPRSSREGRAGPPRSRDSGAPWTALSRGGRGPERPRRGKGRTGAAGGDPRGPRPPRAAGEGVPTAAATTEGGALREGQSQGARPQGRGGFERRGGNPRGERPQGKGRPPGAPRDQRQERGQGQGPAQGRPGELAPRRGLERGGRGLGQSRMGGEPNRVRNSTGKNGQSGSAEHDDRQPVDRSGAAYTSKLRTPGGNGSEGGGSSEK